MKKLVSALLLNLICITVHAQQKKMDSLLTKLNATTDIKQAQSLFGQVHLLPGGDHLLLKNSRKNLESAKLANDKERQIMALLEICAAAKLLNDPPTQLDAALQGIRLGRDTRNDKYLPEFLNFAAYAYLLERDIRHSINYFKDAAKLLASRNNIFGVLSKYSRLETAYVELKMPDSALFYARQEFFLANRLKGSTKWEGLSIAYMDMGELFINTGKADSAVVYYHKGADIEGRHLHKHFDDYSENNIAKAYMQLGKPDSARKYALNAYDHWEKAKRWDYVIISTSLLAQLYENRDPKQSIFYLKAQLAAQDSLTANDRIKQLQLVGDRDEQRQQELQVQQERFNSRIRLYSVIAAAFVLLVVGLMLWRNNRRQKQVNELLNEQKEKIGTQRDHLESALQYLKTTQNQLIQSEKMASLGELTAGIAHEIQNPLNFVNNFSEVNVELIDELLTEMQRGDLEEAQAIAGDLQENERKINEHGRRADSIVKGMLEHSRTSTGQKAPVDLNKLADEYLRLAYHGLRAKDKSFKAMLLTDFDESLPLVMLVPQDMGRVLLNLFNNAFYAVQQKATAAGTGYTPTVTLTTRLAENRVTLTVHDNGTGIPAAIRDKVMQPFFTTKPTGQGTGLGLSLSYDIVTKGHGGTLAVTSAEGQYTQFEVALPL